MRFTCCWTFKAVEFATAAEIFFVHCTWSVYCTVQTFFQCSNVASLHTQDAAYKTSTARFSSRPGGYKGSIDRKSIFLMQLLKACLLYVQFYTSNSIIIFLFVFYQNNLRLLWPNNTLDKSNFHDPYRLQKPTNI